MNEEHGPRDHQSTSPPDKPGWLTYLFLAITTGASAYLALLLAALSINQVVIEISIVTSIVCFALILKLVSKNRSGWAFLLSLAITPITFGLAVLYFDTQSIRIKAAQKFEELRHSTVVKLVDPQPSLDRAIQAGAIRKATAQDVQAFRDAYIEKKYLKKGLLTPENEDALSVTRVDVSRAYVVLTTFTFPSGLVNEYKAVFFVPTGVPKPSGDYGHSAIYDFATLTVECKLARTGGISC